MKLTKKHIGGIFDVQGGDGSWAYQLVDVSKDELLFYVIGDSRFEIESRKYNDWRRFTPRIYFAKSRVDQEWQNARRSR